MTKEVAYWGAAYRIGVWGNRIPGAGFINDSLNKRFGIEGGNFARGFATSSLQSRLPVWKHIVGAPIPKSGTEQVLVYI